MRIVVFGLSVSSSWGNGHATLWRALCKALARRDHHVTFFERDVPYYAAHRDQWELPGGRLILYSDWVDVVPIARGELRHAELAIVTSYCPDALAATELMLDSQVATTTFYDMDSPITLERLASGMEVEYIGPRGLQDFDLVLSYAGGDALEQLKSKLGARIVAPLYGTVDPEVHKPAQPDGRYRAHLSYLGTHSPDRAEALQTLFVDTAKRLPSYKFLIGGSKYDDQFPWQNNIHFSNHVSCADHSAFYSSSNLTLNVTRRAMALNGYCPSGRLFEAAACGAAILSDSWCGLESFFEPGAEILVAQTTDEAIGALQRSPNELQRIARAGRERTLDQHTADIRALDLERILENLPYTRQGPIEQEVA